MRKVIYAHYFCLQTFEKYRHEKLSDITPHCFPPSNLFHHLEIDAISPWVSHFNSSVALGDVLFTFSLLEQIPSTDTYKLKEGRIILAHSL